MHLFKSYDEIILKSIIVNYVNIYETETEITHSNFFNIFRPSIWLQYQGHDET